MKLKWKQRKFTRKSGEVRIKEPKRNGDYLVTDGYVIELGHYHGNTGWGIYQADSTGMLQHCFRLDDMNFDIIAFSELNLITIPKKFQAF